MLIKNLGNVETDCTRVLEMKYGVAYIYIFTREFITILLIPDPINLPQTFLLILQIF